jgi:hypothetical protein
MNIDNKIILIKGACWTLVGGLGPLVAGSTAGKTSWLGVLAGCLIGASSQLLSFLSTDYSEHKQEVAAQAKLTKL